MTSKFSLIPADAIFDQRITPQHLRTLAVLSWHGGNKPDGCWPSYLKLAAQIKISRRLLITYINHLCECGYVEKTVRPTADGRNRSNIYRVIIDIVLSPVDGEAGHHRHGEAPHHPDGDAGHHSIEEPNKLEPEKIKYTKKAVLVSLQEWEKALGIGLNAEMMKSWCQSKGLSRAVVAPLVDEFRIEMMGKDKRYADFKLTFMTYLTKGYLSMTLGYAQEKSRTLASTEVHNRGVNL